MYIWFPREDRAGILQLTKKEMEAIDAKKQAQMLQADVGRVRARETVEAIYRKEKAQLNDKQKEQAKSLQDHPDKLAAFLVRAGK